MMKYSLAGNWKMRQAGENVWHDAVVPGSVYSDLLRDGTIPDPFYRENELEAFQLLRNDFEYERSFSLTADDLEHTRLVLRCEGIDTLADVFLNGEKIAYVDNMHITWEWDVKPLLRAGDNQLRFLQRPIRSAY